MSRTNSHLFLASADLYRAPAPARTDPLAAAPWHDSPRFDPEEGKFPTVLGFLTALYLVSVVILSAADLQASWVPQVIGLMLGVAWLVVGVFLRGQEIRWVWPISLFVLFTLWELTGLFVTVDLTYFISNYTTQIKVAGITWICLQCVRTRRDVLICFLLLGLASVFVLLQGIDSIIYSIEFAGKRGAKGTREGTALLSNANTLGEFGVVALIGVTACVMGYKNVLARIISAGAGVAALYIVAASGSRTAMLGVVLFAAALYVFHFRKAGASSAGRRLLLVFLSLCVLLGSAYFVAKLPFFFRLQEVFSSKEALLKEPRVEYFFRALESTAQHPVFGLGMGGFALARLGTGKGGEGHYSHSSVSETLSCTGIPGFLLYFGAQLALFKLLLKTRKLPLPKSDRTMVNVIMCHYWVCLLFNVISVMDGHRLAWPFMGGLLGYVWNLNKEYSQSNRQYALA